MAGRRRNSSVRYGRTSTLCLRALCTIGYNVAAVRPPFALPKKQEILSSDGDRPQEPFDAVGVEWDAAVFEEALESFPAVEHVVDRFRQFGRRTQFRADFEELRAQPLEDRGSRKTRTVAGRRPRNRRDIPERPCRDVVPGSGRAFRRLAARRFGARTRSSSVRADPAPRRSRGATRTTVFATARVSADPRAFLDDGRQAGAARTGPRPATPGRARRTGFSRPPAEAFAS